MKTWLHWSGRILSTFGVLICLSSVFAKLTHDGQLRRQWERLGFAESNLTGVGLVQLSGIVLYVIPSTSTWASGDDRLSRRRYRLVGPAGRAHTDDGATVDVPAPLGGLFLREERLQALLPLRKKNGASM